MKTKMEIRGKRRTVWLPDEMDAIIEQARRKLGMNRSAFYKYALTKLLQELNLLTSTVHEGEKNG